MAAPIRHVKILANTTFLTPVRCASSYVKRTEVQQKYKKRRKVTFLDSLRVFARGGAGGQGLPKHGGIGGDGGNVILVAKEGQTLLQLADNFHEKRFTAGSGGNSRKFHLLGEVGNDMKVNVPVGVTATTDEGRVIGELNSIGQELPVAHGGKGGNPVNNFLGQKGEAHTVTLDLKLIADIGLVGFPNAGKSTFLGASSRAKPKIASYPFTTIRPQIGTMIYEDGRSIKVADLPGLIEGAHVNFGMGHKFLKHVERTKLLLFMVDVWGFQLGVRYRHRSAFETVLLLNKELELYREDLIGKPAVLALNKIDTQDGRPLAEEVLRLVRGLPETMESVHPSFRPSKLIRFDEILTLSAKTGEFVPELKNRLRTLLDVYAELDREKSRQLVSNHLDSDVSTSQFTEHSKSKLV